MENIGLWAANNAIIRRDIPEHVILARTSFHTERAENKYLLEFITQIFRYSVHTFSLTFLSILADPSNAEF